MANEVTAYENEVRDVLLAFQQGYERRDVHALDSFMHLFDSDAEVIGTSGIVPGQGEWCRALAPIRDLVGFDWQGWGKVSLDLGRARVEVGGDVAWVAAPGVVTENGRRWPLRITAVLRRRENRWLFRQLHFSLATEDCRVVSCP